jgi:hypothetical protein
MSDAHRTAGAGGIKLLLFGIIGASELRERGDQARTDLGTCAWQTSKTFQLTARIVNFVSPMISARIGGFNSISLSIACSFPLAESAMASLRVSRVFSESRLQIVRYS